MNILILGGCGYTGSPLTKLLLDRGHNVKVIDIQWFGNYLKKDKKLKIEKKDIRNLVLNDFKNVDIVIHLANIANDPSVDLSPHLSWDVNVLCIKKICEYSIKQKVKKIIYASSGSVYGIKDEPLVTEDLELVPISVYNKTKMIAERVFNSFNRDIEVFNIRPATVCGISERMRLDVSVNMLTYQAVKDKKIKVFGGDQIRPNIHIDDLIDVYLHFLTKKLTPGTYNAGFENLKIIEIAEMIKLITNVPIEITKNSNDPRSYRLSSEKLLRTGFMPKKNVKRAIEELYEIYVKDISKFSEKNFNVLWLKKILS